MSFPLPSSDFTHAPGWLAFYRPFAHLIIEKEATICQAARSVAANAYLVVCLGPVPSTPSTPQCPEVPSSHSPVPFSWPLVPSPVQMFVDKFADVRVSCASRSWRMADAITRESRLPGAVLQQDSGARSGQKYC